MTPVKWGNRRVGYLGKNEDAMHVVGHDNPFVQNDAGCSLGKI